MEINRWPARAPGRSRAVQWQGLVWAVASTGDVSLAIDEQITDCLQSLDRTLAEAGSDKTRLLSVQVFLAEMDFKPKLDEAWNAWIGPDPNHWPQRACLGVGLAPGLLVEIVALAAVRDAHSSMN
jgi:enamine deaminase RidA (YjgF/YER057c/UK114 family)